MRLSHYQTKRASEVANADDPARDHRAYDYSEKIVSINTRKSIASASSSPLGSLLVLRDFLGQQFQQHLMPIFITRWILLILGDQLPVERNIRIMNERRHCSLHSDGQAWRTDISECCSRARYNARFIFEKDAQIRDNVTVRSAESRARKALAAT